MPVLLVATPTDISPTGADVVARCTSKITFRELRKNKVYYSPVRVHGSLGPHSQVVDREREGRCVDLGLCLYWDRGWGA